MKKRRRAFPHEHAPEPEHDVVQPAHNRDYGRRVANDVRGRIASTAEDARAFAGRLVELLDGSGVTVDDVAARLKFSVRQVKQWTTAGTPTIPDPSLLLALCRAYRFSPAYLLLGAGPPSLAQLSPSPDLKTHLRESVAEQLRARDHDESSISALLEHDGDVLARLVATYDARLRLIPAARILGLSPEQLEFATREIEVRLVVARPTRNRKTATQLAAEKYAARSQTGSQSSGTTGKSAPRSGRGSSKADRRR